MAGRLPSFFRGLHKGLTRLPRVSFTTSSAWFGISKKNPNSQYPLIISRKTGKREDLWQQYNEVVYPPKDPSALMNSDGVSQINVDPRPGEVTHRREDILYSQKKLWLLGFMIRGMAVDDAFAQLGFRPEKGARILEQVIEEAIELAVTEHDFEYSTKIWIETVHVSRGRAIPRVYKGVRSQVFMDNYHYANLYIRLREGDPPEIYHPRRVPATWTPSPACPEGGQPSWGSGTDILHRELNRLRTRRIKSGL